MTNHSIIILTFIQLSFFYGIDNHNQPQFFSLCIKYFSIQIF
nr:MAG TPA: hypothetical protein [Caudoviricetes sp.]